MLPAGRCVAWSLLRAALTGLAARGRARAAPLHLLCSCMRRAPLWTRLSARLLPAAVAITSGGFCALDREGAAGPAPVVRLLAESRQQPQGGQPCTHAAAGAARRGRLPDAMGWASRTRLGQGPAKPQGEFPCAAPLKPQGPQSGGKRAVCVVSMQTRRKRARALQTLRVPRQASKCKSIIHRAPRVHTCRPWGGRKRRATEPAYGRRAPQCSSLRLMGPT
ncbi:MAG: hypothetical protein J3K34DRAFT_445776 [Monoraphidium minutum]|nr:MAG: hypothetical protein J3K34DRAFT_445776 [Monoraphidium minutum]